MKTRILFKIFNLLASFLIAVWPVVPALPLLPSVLPVYAQEASPVPDGTGASSEPTASPNPTIDPASSPMPEESPAPSEQPAVSPSHSPSDESQNDNSSLPSTDQNNQNSSEDQNNGSNENKAPPSSSPSPTPSIAVDNNKEGEGQVTAEILSTASAQDTLGLDLVSLESEGSATLSTDRPDYAPTDVALITGSNFSANTTYTIVITSEDPPAVDHQDQVTTDESGNFTYFYQLDGTYRPNYKVEVKDSSGTIVASTTFTDTDTSTLSPDGQGNYTAWTGNEDDIDETGTPDCEDSNNDGDDNVASGTTGQRESINIDLSSILNGSTVTSVQVLVWDQASTTSGGKYKTFVRVGSTDSDSGVSLATTSTSGCTQRTQTIDIPDFVKSGSTDLEAGVLKTSTNTNTVRIGAIRAVVTYDPAPQPDLTATKTNNVSGNATVNQAFTWTIRVQNSGSATATFSNNQDILWDERPSTGVSSYGTPTITTSGTTGNFDCTQSGTNSRDLVCEANGAATMPAGSYIDIAYTVTPSAVGALSNPRSGQSCEADDDNIVAESNENNNDCSNSVTVVAANVPPSFDPIADQAVNENSSSQDVAITNVSPGPSGESGQTVTMSATSSDPTIVPNPSVSGAGSTRTLTYTPAANKFGTVTITVTADDGQSENNTYPRTFTIIVNQDTTPPTDPADVVSTSHEVDTPTSDSTIDMAWSAAGEENGATDDNSGVDGYSYAFTSGAGDVPDVEKDAEEDATGTTSEELADASWYFHLRTVDNEGNWSSTVHVGPFPIDTSAPILSEVTPVSTPTNNSTPNYTFNAGEAGNITYGGSCSSVTNSAVAGDNTISFDSLSDGTYSDCTITVTDSAGNPSDPLSVSTFTVDTQAPEVSTPFVSPDPTNHPPQILADAVDALSNIVSAIFSVDDPDFLFAKPLEALDGFFDSLAETLFGPENTNGMDYPGEGLHTLYVGAYDEAGNFGSNSGPFTVDTNAPTVESAQTQDQDGDGYIDGIKLTFSENIDDSRLNVGSADGWDVVDYDGEAIGTGEGENDNILLLTFSEGESFDTGATPTVTYTPSGGGDLDPRSTHDAVGNELEDGEWSTSDGAPPLIPVADPAAGDYFSDQSVTLTSNDDGGTGLEGIYYTTDGSTPDNSSTPYTDPIAIGVDTTLKAIAYDNAGNPSDVLTAEYGIAPVISDETSGSVTDTSVTITWITDDPATSRVLYDSVSHPSLGGAPNYGYANSTDEEDADPKVTSHSVDISGLTSGTTYFYRTVSHGSPEAVGDEKSVTTTSPATTSGGGGGDGQSDGLGCGSKDCSGNVVGVPQVLGALISPLATGFSPEVLGETTSEAQLSPAPTQGVLGEEGKSVEEKPLIQINKGFGWKKISASVFVIILIFFLFWFFRRRRAEK